MYELTPEGRRALEDFDDGVDLCEECGAIESLSDDGRCSLCSFGECKACLNEAKVDMQNLCDDCFEHQYCVDGPEPEFRGREAAAFMQEEQSRIQRELKR